MGWFAQFDMSCSSVAANMARDAYLNECEEKTRKQQAEQKLAALAEKVVDCLLNDEYGF